MSFDSLIIKYKYNYCKNKSSFEIRNMKNIM